MAANNSPVAAAIEQYGDDRQKSDYLTKLSPASGSAAST